MIAGAMAYSTLGTYFNQQLEQDSCIVEQDSCIVVAVKLVVDITVSLYQFF